jgi:integrase
VGRRGRRRLPTCLPIRLTAINRANATKEGDQRYGERWLATWPDSRAIPVRIPSPTFAPTCCGARTSAWILDHFPGAAGALPALDAGDPRVRPSTVARRLSAVGGFYGTCVIDGILDHSPADYLRRPPGPPRVTTFGLAHLQLEAMLHAARESTNPIDFALVAMLCLLGLRIFEATGASINDFGEEHGHRVLRVHGKGDKVVLVPLPTAVARAIDTAADGRGTGPSCVPTVAPGRTANPLHAACVDSPRPPASDCRECTRTCCATPSSPPCSRPAWTYATS